MALPRLIKYERNTHRKQLEAELCQWFGTPLGLSVLEVEKQILSHVLPTRFGYHSLYTGVGPSGQLLESCQIPHKVHLTELPLKNHPDESISMLCAASMAIPLENNSIDLIVMHHSLDYVRSPHGVLREMSRVLIPGGSMVIIGFNPLSLWGGWKAARFKTYDHDKISTAPWNTHFISPYRLTDWMALLEMEVEGCESGFYYPPVGGRLGRMLHQNSWRGVNSSSWYSRLISKALAQRGAVYVMVAKKMTACMTPVKPRLKIRRRSVVAVPAARLESYEPKTD